ncbi:hypothetical protein AB0J20_25830 [Micromonospora costi]|uniref:hypothetical protein n=1 Tax=Micromonospora costi TaxID=1530042 RepID=UPI0034019D2B
MRDDRGAAGVPADSLAQALVTRYPPGAVVGGHRDASAFGPTVAGLSPGSACLLGFQRGRGEQVTFRQVRRS